MRIVLTVSYDGTAYCGWQRQENGLSVQETIENAIRKITGEDITVTGAGRTDAGVHALGQTVHFDTESNVPADRFSYAINAYLPPDVRIKKSCAADPDFHARFSAKGKTYRYYVYNNQHASAVMRNFSMHEPRTLDIDAMRRAAVHLKGEHDFSAFCASGAQVKSFVREISQADINKNGDMLEFVFTGNGFLYNMVRIMVGTLIYVGVGKINENDMPDILASKDRTRAGITAPPHGLFLEKVYY